MKNYRELLLTVALFVVCLVEFGSAGSCRAAKLCCQGRDSGCVIQKAFPNAIIETPRDKPCYCDHACLKLADCCDDFNETCTVSDCELGSWSEWSECDNRCGAGQRTRSRSVLRPERNGGKPCGSTEETETCQNYDFCRRRARHFQLVETSFNGDAETAASTLDSNFVPQVTTKGYCAGFTLIKVSRGCRRRLEQPLEEGSKVCVRCDAESVSGCHLDRRSLEGIARWELLTAERTATNCHGKWLAVTDSWTKCASCPARLTFV